MFGRLRLLLVAVALSASWLATLTDAYYGGGGGGCGCGCCPCCRCYQYCAPQPPIIIQPPPALHNVCHVPCCCRGCCCGCCGGRRKRNLDFLNIFRIGKYTPCREPALRPLPIMPPSLSTVPATPLNILAPVVSTGASVLRAKRSLLPLMMFAHPIATMPTRSLCRC